MQIRIFRGLDKNEVEDDANRFMKTCNAVNATYSVQLEPIPKNLSKECRVIHNIAVVYESK